MYSLIFFVCALLAPLSNSFVWIRGKKDESNDSLSDLSEDYHPKNIILFMGQPGNRRNCNNNNFSYTEPEYVRFPLVKTVKSCLEFRSDQQKCGYCEEALQLAVSNLMDVAADVKHVPSGLISLTNFSVYNLNADSKVNIHSFRGQHFQYHSGFEETERNETEIQDDTQSESEGLIYAMMKEIHAIQTSFCRNLLKAFGFIEPLVPESEDRYYLSDVPKLVDLVQDMLRKLETSHNGFLLIVNDGELQEHCATEDALNLRNAVMTAINETDPKCTLIAVTASCAEGEDSDTVKVYAQGPGSKELADATFLWNVPGIMSRIWQRDFKPKPTKATIPRAKIESSGYNFKKAPQFSTQTIKYNEKDKSKLVILNKKGKFYDKFKANIIKKQPEDEMEYFHKQNVKDMELERFLQNITETLNATQQSDENKEMNLESTSAAQKSLDTRDSIVSYIESSIKEYEHKPSARHLPQTETNEKSHEVLTTNNEINMQTHNILTSDNEKNLPSILPPSDEKETKSEKILLNTQDMYSYFGNLTVFPEAELKQDSVPSKEELDADLAIKNAQHNAEKENSIANELASKEKHSVSPIMTKNSK